MRVVSAAIIIALVLASTAISAGVVAAEETPANNSTKEQAQDKLWDVVVEDEDKTATKDKQIITTIGPNTWVTDVRFDDKSGLAYVTITTQKTVTLTFTDSSGIDARKQSGTFAEESKTVPRGTYTVVAKSSVDYRGNQMVTVTGGSNNIWLSNGDTDISILPGPFGTWESRLFLLVGVLGGLGTLLLLIRLRHRKQLSKGVIRR